MSEAAITKRPGDAISASRRVPEAEKAPLVRAVFDSVAPRYDLMNDLMSGGIHRWWKAEMVAWLNPRPGQRPARCRRRHRRHRAARSAAPARRRAADGSVIVCDASQQMLDDRPRPRSRPGHSRPASSGCAAMPSGFRLPTAASISTRSPSGCGTSPGSMRRLPRRGACSKPGGRFLCLEFTPAITPLLQPLYDLYSFQILPLLGQIVTGDREAYTYLVESIRRFPRQSELAGNDRARRARSGEAAQPDRGIAALHSAWRL